MAEIPRDTDPSDPILDAASAVFAEHGYGGARIDEIAARAGVNKAMLYYRVGDKKTLYTAVLMRNFDRVEAVLQQALEDHGSVRRRLEALIAGLTDAVTTYPDHPRIVLREIASGGATLPEPVLDRMLGVVEIVAGVIGEGTAAGELRELDPVLTHLTLVGSVLFLSATRPIRSRAAAVRPGLPLADPESDIAAYLSTLLLDGLATDPDSGGSR